MAVQLKRLLKGQHPQTRQQLGPPKAAQQDGGTAIPDDHLAASGEQSERTGPCIASDGTDFTEAFLRRGKRSLESTAGSSAAERLRSKQASQLLKAAGNKRKIEEMLNVEERRDPDLVEFWTNEVEEVQRGELDGEAGSPTTLEQEALQPGQSPQVFKKRCIELVTTAPRPGSSAAAKPCRLARLGIERHGEGRATKQAAKEVETRTSETPPARSLRQLLKAASFSGRGPRQRHHRATSDGRDQSTEQQRGLKTGSEHGSTDNHRDHGGGVWDMLFPGEPRTKTGMAGGGGGSMRGRQGVTHKPGLKQVNGRVQPPLGSRPSVWPLSATGTGSISDRSST